MDTDNSSKIKPFITDIPGENENASIQLDAIFRAFPDILFVLDRQGTILEYRSGDSSMLYLPPEQFLGKRMQEVLPAEVAEKFAKAIQSLGQSNLITTLKYELQIPQGKRWFDARLVYSPNARIVAVVRDITDHVQAAERVRQQLRQISALHAIDVAITSSFDLRVTLSVILREVLNQLSVDAADVMLFNQTTRMLEYAGGQGFRTPGFQRASTRIGQGFVGTAALERRTISTTQFNASRQGVIASRELQVEGFVSYYAVPLLAKGQVRGVLEIFHRSSLQPGEAWLEFLAALASRAALAIDSAELFQNLQQTNTELSLAYDSAIEGWAQALEISGRESPEHTRRVLDLTLRLAQQLGIAEHELAQMQRGVLLHDVGNLGIPETILLKGGPLTEEEWAVIRGHPKLASQMLHSIPYLAPAMEIPRNHHERWDGSGYPQGLHGEEIPLAARIFAVVDVYDALVSTRPYREAWTTQEALDYIWGQSGKLFDPKVVNPFIEIIAHTVPDIDMEKVKKKLPIRGIE